MILHSFVPQYFGFGDFLRGHIALLQQYGISNVAMSLQKTPLIKNFNSENFVTHCSSTEVTCDQWWYVYPTILLNDEMIKPRMMCCNHFARFPISLEIKNHLKNLLELNSSTYERIFNILTSLTLETAKFNVLHVRLNREHLDKAGKMHVTNGCLNKSNVESILKEIANHKLDDMPLFICADNNTNKLCFKQSDTVKFLNQTFKHSAVVLNNSDNLSVHKILDDHFIMRFANKIIQVTDDFHFWGSGYSDSVNWIWDVPILHVDVNGNEKTICVDREEALRQINKN